LKRGGEATHYVAQYGQRQRRVAKLVLIGAVPPIAVKTRPIRGGPPIEVFDGLRKTLAANRAQFYLDFSSGPLYGFNRPGAKPIFRRVKCRRVPIETDARASGPSSATLDDQTTGRNVRLRSKTGRSRSKQMCSGLTPKAAPKAAK
jgi:pimeloyl-ACP methyl ester carboxylesterase